MRLSFPVLVVLVLAAAAIGAAQERVYVALSGDTKVAVIDGVANRVVSQIAVSPAPQAVVVSVDGRRLFVSSEGKNAIDVVDRVTSKPVRSVAAGQKPGDLLLAPEGRKLFASLRGGGAVEVIDTATLEKTRTIFTGKDAAGLALTPDNTRILAASAGRLSVINIRTEAVEFEIPVAGLPMAVAFEADKSLVVHRVFVQLAGAAGIDIIDWAQRKSVGKLAGAAQGVGASLDRKTLWVTGQEGITVYSLPELKKVATVVVGKGAGEIVFTPDRKRAFVASVAEGTVSVIDAVGYREVVRIPVGKGPRGLAIAE